jgi:rhodanese-related sulfurtransferase
MGLPPPFRRLQLRPRAIPETQIVPNRKSTCAILLEAMMVVAVAAGFAFAANALSPHGLKLARDYFPGSASPVNAATGATQTPAVNSATTNENSEEADINRRIKEKGLQPIDRAQTERLFHDPRYQQGLVVFIDARDEAHYAEGHIPGAYPLDRYHPEKDLAADLTPCQTADQIVVYCTGGDCEDAEYTALLLRDAGVPNQKIFVYGGGFDDWSTNHLPLEQGPRGSGLAPVESK